MKLLIKIFDYLYDLVHSEETLEKSRFKSSFFTRKRKLPFEICLIIGLAHFTGSLAYGLDQFFSYDTGKDIVVTGPAYTLQREKFSPYPYETAFKGIRDIINDEYQENGSFETRFGLQVIAVDGSYVALPNYDSLREGFGGTGAGKKSATARMTILYDTLNDIIYEAALDPLSVDEREQAKKLINQMGQSRDISRMVFVFDRGYFSSELVDVLEKHKAFYIFRMRRGLRPIVDSAPPGDHLVSIGLNKKRRLLKFPISTPDGSETVEALLTNWKTPKLEDFKELYFLRWPIETEYDTIKNKIEMPNFNAVLTNGIYQDFWISMVIANIVGVVVLETDKIIASKHRNHKNKCKYQASISEAVNSIHVDLPRILLSENEEKRKQRIIHLLSYASENEEPGIPNRSVPRTLVRKVRYHYNRKHH